MIYDRWGNPVALLRYATATDVQKLERRKPDKTDQAALENNSYVIIQAANGAEQLLHQAYLKADGGAVEIAAVIDLWPRPFTAADFKRIGRGVVLECCPPASTNWRSAVVVSRTKTTLHVDVSGGAPQSFSFSASDAKKWLRWPGSKAAPIQQLESGS